MTRFFVNIWNKLRNVVDDVDPVDLFKSKLTRFKMQQDVMYYYKTELTGTGRRRKNLNESEFRNLIRVFDHDTDTEELNACVRLSLRQLIVGKLNF